MAFVIQSESGTAGKGMKAEQHISIVAYYVMYRREDILDVVMGCVGQVP